MVSDEANIVATLARKLARTARQVEAGCDLTSRSLLLLSHLYRFSAYLYMYQDGGVLSDAAWDRLARFLTQPDIKEKIVPVFMRADELSAHTGMGVKLSPAEVKLAVAMAEYAGKR